MLNPRRLHALLLLCAACASLAGCQRRRANARPRPAPAPPLPKIELPPLPEQEPRPARRVLQVFHTSNVAAELDPCGWGHRLGGLARRAGIIDSYRGRGDGVLVLDAGDALLANSVATIEPGPLDQARAATLMQAHGMLGLDALTPGEAELAFGMATLERLSKQASVTLLVANLEGQKGVTPRKLVELGSGAGQIRVGLLGLFEVQKAEPALPKRLHLKVGDPVAAARTQVEALHKEGAEVIILLAHLGMPRAREVVKAVPGIHLAVVAHSGYRTMEPERVVETGTLLVESGRRGQSLGRVELRLGDGWNANEKLVDDSRRFVLRLEAGAEIERVKKGLAAVQGDVLRQRIMPSVERARLLAKQLRELKPPAALHTAISTLTELDDSQPENAAMKAFVTSARRGWPPPPPVSPQLQLVRPVRLR